CRGPLGDQKPASAVAVEAIDPVLAIRRLAGLRQALFIVRIVGRSGHRGFLGSAIEQRLEGVRECRRRRESCENESRRKAKSQRPGHGNSRCCAPGPQRDLSATWVHNATQIRQAEGLIPAWKL